MDESFYDMKIPRRPSEQLCPEDLAIHFAFLKDRSMLRLDLHGASMPLQYGGKGRILLENGFCRVAQLSTLDPFLTSRRFIPSKFFKIFFRVQYPKIASSGYCVTSELEMEKSPAVQLCVDTTDPEHPSCEVHWNAHREALCFLDGFDEYTISGGHCYPGPRQVINAVSHLADGTHPLDERMLSALRAHYRDAPYLFQIRGSLYAEDPAPARRAGMPVRAKPEGENLSGDNIIQQTFAAFRDFAESFRTVPNTAQPARSTPGYGVPPPPPKTFSVDGPALLSFSHTANVRAENGKFAFFTIEAKRFADYRPEKAEFVPFTCYWPVYSKMSREQRAWYFYWRDQFRKGNALKTDLSYIFVYIYELINRAYGSAEDGLTALFSLWHTYRTTFARLDYYMPIYCADYMILNGLHGRLGEIQRRFTLEPGSMRPFAELYLNDQLREGLHALPFETLCELSDYKLRQSRFYQQQPALCQDTVRQVFSELDHAMRVSKNESLLSSFSPAPVTASWTAYSGAVCGRSAARQIRAEYIPYASDPALRTFITGVIKHTENGLRKRSGYAGRLRGYTLSEPVSALIDRLTGARTASSVKTEISPPQQAPQPVEIDLEAAKRLELASWENTKKLIDAVESAQDARPADEIPETENTLPSPPAPQPVEDAQLGGGADPMEYADVYAAFISALSGFQRSFLAALLAGEPYDALCALAAREFSFPEAVFEELNELAQTCIGDLILSPDDGEIYEEHQDALTRALTEETGECNG